MRNDFLFYLEILRSDIPFLVYEIMLASFIIVGIILYFQKRREGAFKGILFLILVEYIALLYCTTVFFRSANDGGLYNIRPFWSYDQPDLLVSNIMNVIVFTPIGFLISYIIKIIKWWTVLLIGITISVSIELLQFLLKSGFSEVDDVIHNTLGCMIGYGIYKLIIVSYEKISKRSLDVL